MIARNSFKVIILFWQNYTKKYKFFKLSFDYLCGAASILSHYLSCPPVHCSDAIAVEEFTTLPQNLAGFQRVVSRQGREKKDREYELNHKETMDTGVYSTEDRVIIDRVIFWQSALPAWDRYTDRRIYSAA